MCRVCRAVRAHSGCSLSAVPGASSSPCSELGVDTLANDLFSKSDPHSLTQRQPLGVNHLLPHPLSLCYLWEPTEAASFMLLFKEGEWPGILKITKSKGFTLTGSEIIP